MLKRTQQKERRQYGSTKPSTSNAVETVVINPCVNDESMAVTEDNSMTVAEDISKIVAKDDSMIIAEDDNMIVAEDDCMIVKDDSMIAAEVVLDNDNDNAQAENIVLTSRTQQPPEGAAANELTQCNFVPHLLLTIERLERNAEPIKYYTGFDDYDHFMLMFSILGPNTQCIGLNDCGLSAVNQFFLTMIKLRQGKDDYEVSFLLGVSKAVVSNVFTTWINFMYCQLKELDIWPSRESVSANMPGHFKELFPTTRVILDATEVPIQKPKNANVQSSTFSTYENKNTLKVMVGCTPKGTVSFISDAYGGCTSDREIIERSALNTSEGMFTRKDSIMADRGIMVQDLFIYKGVKVNMPTMLKGKSQLEEHEVIDDRRIASKRIHVERVIGLAKTYKILKKDLPAHRLFLGNRIINVCFMLTLFRKSIVSDYA